MDDKPTTPSAYQGEVQPLSPTVSPCSRTDALCDSWGEGFSFAPLQGWSTLRHTTHLWVRICGIDAMLREGRPPRESTP